MIALLLAAASPAEAATVRVLSITNASADPLVPFKGFDGNPPKVFDVDGDGDLEIIAQNDNQWVYIFDSRTGKILTELTTAFPSGWGARTFNGPEVTILNDGTSPRLVLMNSAAVLTVYRFDPSGSSSSKFLFHKEWDERLDDCYSNPGSDSKPTLADLDRDGRLEILATTEESGVYAFRSNGALYWKKCISGGNAEPTVADLNRDGWPEVVHVSDGGVVSALNGQTGAYKWAFNARTHFNLGSGSMPVGATVAQLDGVGGPDVVVGARDSHDAENFDNNHALLLALNSEGKLLWGRQDHNANPLTYTHPIVVDAHGDGQAEVYWADWNTMGHKPPWNEAEAWKVTGPANFYRFDRWGNVVWRTELGTWWQNKDLAMGDVDGDGIQEILANGPNAHGHDGIWYLDTHDGSKDTFVDLYPWQASRGPILADLWNTGKMQWVIQAGPATSSAGGPAILVYDTQVRYNALWPHLPYTSRSRDGSPSPEPTTSPPSGEFDAQFSGVGGNNWWVQVNVDANQALSGVNARVDCGTWKALAKQSWGAWAASFHIPTGSKVDFQARSTSGATDLSGGYLWPDATPTSGCSTTTPPPSDGFDATFSGVGGNEWWVQTNVAANEPLAGVDARVNCGSWKALEKKSWGGWAASFHIPSGSKIDFRARSTSGATDLSGGYIWPEATPTSGCGTSGGTGEFAATFDPRAVGNDWWVEVAVESSHSIARVETSINGGAWTTLDRTSWGTWAKSLHAPNGSSVKFRATDSAGAQATSSTYTWT